MMSGCENSTSEKELMKNLTGQDDVSKIAELKQQISQKMMPNVTVLQSDVIYCLLFRLDSAALQTQRFLRLAVFLGSQPRTPVEAIFLPERDYVKFWSLLSQICLSSVVCLSSVICLSVTLVHPTHC